MSNFKYRANKVNESKGKQTEEYLKSLIDKPYKAPEPSRMIRPLTPESKVEEATEAPRVVDEATREGINSLLSAASIDPNTPVIINEIPKSYNPDPSIEWGKDNRNPWIIAREPIKVDGESTDVIHKSDRDEFMDLLTTNVHNNFKRDSYRHFLWYKNREEGNQQKTFRAVDSIDDVIDEHESDVYFTPNLYLLNSIDSTIESVKYLTSLFIDIDDASVEEVEVRLKATGLPRPTVTIDSGRGVHLYWVFDSPVNVKGQYKQGKYKGKSYNRSKAWKRLQSKFTELLDGDSKVQSISNNMRLPGTINSRNGRECKIVNIDKALTYNFFELRDKYTQVELFTASNDKDKESTNSDYINNYTTPAINDLELLAQMRGGIQEGHRTNYLLRLKGLWADDETIIYFNDVYCTPSLRKSEVQALLRQDKPMKPVRMQTIIDDLDITEEEWLSFNVIKPVHYRSLRDKTDSLYIQYNKIHRVYLSYLQMGYKKHSKKTDGEKAEDLCITIKTLKALDDSFDNLSTTNREEQVRYQRELYASGGVVDGIIKPKTGVELLIEELNQLSQQVNDLIHGDDSVYFNDELESLRPYIDTLQSYLSIPVYNPNGKNYKVRELKEQARALKNLGIATQSHDV